MSKENCPCGSLKNNMECCSRFIDGKAIPSTPEELMRSRYTAFTQANMDYIANTMLSPAADGFDPESEKAACMRIQWHKLEVLHAFFKDGKGFVEFKADFSEDETEQVLHELSEFQQVEGRWYYINGKKPNIPIKATQQMGRNHACSCGSGKKFKKCCGK